MNTQSKHNLHEITLDEFNMENWAGGVCVPTGFGKHRQLLI